jgi:cell division GTPase FtsZ
MSEYDIKKYIGTDGVKIVVIGVGGTGCNMFRQF